jgi:hypothetical protein
MALANDCRVMNSERGWMSLNEVNINMRIADSALKYTQYVTSKLFFIAQVSPIAMWTTNATNL